MSEANDDLLSAGESLRRFLAQSPPETTHGLGIVRCFDPIELDNRLSEFRTIWKSASRGVHAETAGLVGKIFDWRKYFGPPIRRVDGTLNERVIFEGRAMLAEPLFDSYVEGLRRIEMDGQQGSRRRVATDGGITVDQTAKTVTYKRKTARFERAEEQWRAWLAIWKARPDPANLIAALDIEQPKGTVRSLREKLRNNGLQSVADMIKPCGYGTYRLDTES